MRIGLIMKTAGSFAVVLTWLVAASCSANSAGSTYGNSTGGAGGGDGGGLGGSGGTQPVLGDASPGDGSLDEAGACVGQSYPGKVVPLDVLILLDATGSMDDSSGTGATPVWPPVTAALQTLISDPNMNGIGMGLTFLPNPPPAGTKIPGRCLTNAECVNMGTCNIMFGCNAACNVDTDCGIYGPCMILGQARFCTGAATPKVSCDPADYGQPVVPIDVLPSNAQALVDAISSKSPDGSATPTQPALTGALSYAHGWAVAHPDHLTNVLFATDGEPNDCTYDTPEGAADVAATAYNDNPSVSTFVLGLGQLDVLNQIAQKGGTQMAYIADSSSVSDKLVDMFNQMRANGACQFQIPVPQSGQTLDYGRVNVSYTPMGASEPQSVPYVKGKGGCDPTAGGWYYDTDPAQKDPTKILLCPATCDGVQLSTEGVEVILGCKTIVK